MVTAEAYATQLVRRGRTEDARKLVAKLPPGIVVIEVNETTPDEAQWPSRRPR